MPSVVFDTNVLISAFITPGGRGDEDVRRVMQGRSMLFTSVPLLTELARKLEGKFGWERERALEAVQFVASLATVVSPRAKLDDPAAGATKAVEAGADLIVTGDRHLLDLGTFKTVRVVTLASFLKVLEG